MHVLLTGGGFPGAWITKGPGLPSAAGAVDEWSSDLLQLGAAASLRHGLEQTIRH